MSVDQMPTMDAVLEAFARWDNYDPYYEGDLLETPDGQISLNQARAALAAHDAEVAAKAWDEGFDAGERDVMEHESSNYDTPCIQNPYRKAAEQ